MTYKSDQATTRVILFTKLSFWKKEKPGKLVFSLGFEGWWSCGFVESG